MGNLAHFVEARSFALRHREALASAPGANLIVSDKVDFHRLFSSSNDGSRRPVSVPSVALGLPVAFVPNRSAMIDRSAGTACLSSYTISCCDSSDLIPAHPTPGGCAWWRR